MANHRRQSASNRANNLMADYKNLRTVPALLGMVFFMSTLYQFGAFDHDIAFAWFDYTLTTEHAVFLSLGVYIVAFASSETRQFENYDGWEKLLIAAGPVLILGTEYLESLNDIVMTTSDPWSMVAAAAIVLIGYGVAVQ